MDNSVDIWEHFWNAHEDKTICIEKLVDYCIKQYLDKLPGDVIKSLELNHIPVIEAGELSVSIGNAEFFYRVYDCKFYISHVGERRVYCGIPKPMGFLTSNEFSRHLKNL